MKFDDLINIQHFTIENSRRNQIMRAMKKDICCCDRCGMFYNYYEGGKTFKDTERANAVCFTDIDLERDYSIRQIYDLCPDCMKKLEKFLNKKTK